MNAFRLGKRAASIMVMLSMVLWTVSPLVAGVAAAADSTCPTLAPGDRIKVKGKAPIYAVNNKLEIMYFPSGYEHDTWTNSSVKGYGGYISIGQPCFDSLKVPAQYPGAVNFRPGSYVVKREASDQLYVILPDNSLAKITVEAAKVLYGANYKVRVVADAFWPHYVNRGADITEGKVHPGMLVKNGGKMWYMDKDNKLREVTDAGMVANGWLSRFTFAVADSAVAGLTLGDKIDGEVKAVTDMTQSGGIVSPTPSPTPTPSPSGSLTVSLASDNAAGSTVVSDTADGAQAMIPVLKLNFSAGSDGDVKVTGVKLKKSGISSDTDVSNLYLYDGMTKLAGNPSTSNGVYTFSSASGLFTVAKGTTKAISVHLSLKNNVASGKTMAFALAASGDVTTAAGSVGGSFPMNGNTFTVASVTDLGKLAFTSVSPSANSTVDPGTKDYEIWRFQAVSSDQDIEVRKLVFTIVGSVNAGDLQNFSLWDGSKMLGSKVADMAADKTVTIDLVAAPYLVTKGQTKILSLKADIVAGTNRTFRASFQNESDIITFDKNYSVYLKANGTDSFTLVQPNTSGTAVNFTVNTGTLTQTLDSTSPTGNIPDGATNVTLAKFKWTANGEDVKISSLSVSSTLSTTSDILANTRLLVNGSQVGSTDTSLTGNGVADTGWGTFGNSFIIKAGTTAEVKIVADTTDATIAADDTIIVGLVVGSSNAQGVTSLTSISTVGQNASTLTVKAGTVTVTKNLSFGNKAADNPTGVVNQTAAKVGSFVVTAGSGEAVEVSQIGLTETANTCIGTYMQNLTLKDSTGKQLGAVYPNPSSSCSTANTYTFNISPAVKVMNGAQYVVDLYADLKAGFTTASTAIVKVDSVTATGVDTGSSASVSSQALSLQNTYISTSGAYLVKIDSDTPVSENYLMGATEQLLGKFNITASSTEAINITKLVISNRVSSAATGTLQNIKLYDNTTGQLIGSPVAYFDTTDATSTIAHAVFNNVGLVIPAGSSKVINVKADIVTYDGGGFTTTGQTSNLLIMKYYTGTTSAFTSTGKSSGVSLTPTVTNTGTNIAQVGADNLIAYANTSTLYRAKLTTAWASDTSSGASSPAAAQVVAKFVITNLVNSGTYPATVERVNFDISSTISNTANRTLTVYKDSLTTTSLATTSTASTGSNEGFADTSITDANFTNVEISAGTSKTFFVTLDTTNAASTKSLSIRIGNADVEWTDGISSDLTVMGQDLPLLYKTFTY